MANIYATNDPILEFADTILGVFREICGEENVIKENPMATKKKTTEDENIEKVIDLVKEREKRINERGTRNSETVNHPSWYGSKDDPYETIKVIEAWGLNFTLGNALKYISRAGKKDPAKTVEDLRKALFYIQYEIDRLEGKKI